MRRYDRDPPDLPGVLASLAPVSCWTAEYRGDTGALWRVAELCRDGRTLVARIDLSGFDSKEELFEAFQRLLRFPDYFGHNWDALEECLHDFYWLEEESVVVVVSGCSSFKSRHPRWFSILRDIALTESQGGLVDLERRLVVVLAYETMAAR